MIVFEGIKLKLGKFILRKKMRRLNRNVKSFSIDKASTIGIVYNATNRQDSEIVKKFVQYLKEERKDVISLGYIDSKDSSEMVKAHLNYIFFDNRHLSFAKIPENSDIQTFIEKPYSILIDLNIDSSFPIEYISSLSKAKFKVGANQHYRDQTCDLILDIDKNRNLEYLIIQIKHYLKMINN